MKKIEGLPDFDRTLVHIDGGLIAFIDVEQDPDPENPIEARGERIISLNRNHSNFDPDAFERLRKDNDCVVLGAYDHSGILWYVSQDSPPPGADCPWDGVRIAGLWVPCDSKCLLEAVSKTKGKKRRKKAVELARSACDVYTAWCNGEVYAYNIQAYKLRRHEDGEIFDYIDDYRLDEELESDSCCGFYLNDTSDRDYMLDQINQILAGIEQP